MDGALGAFASLPRNVLEKHQLVLNDVGDLSKFRSKAYALGLQDDDFVVTGRLSDDDLVALYNLCKVSIYPTLYEGFGLPILEAMSCGAPVIASNNSSIPEVIGRSDAMFDVSNNEDVVRVLHNALTDEAYLRNLTEYGLVRAKQFSWSKTANLTWEAIRLRQNEKLDIENRVYSISPRKPLHRIAFVSPLPPDKSGVAEYSAALLPYLAAYFNIDLFTEIGLEVEDEYIKKEF